MSDAEIVRAIKHAEWLAGYDAATRGEQRHSPYRPMDDRPSLYAHDRVVVTRNGVVRYGTIVQGDLGTGRVRVVFDDTLAKNNVDSDCVDLLDSEQQ